MTLEQIRNAAKDRADMVNSEFISDETWNQYINQSAFELYDLLITVYGNDYHVADPHSFTADGSNRFFELPENFYKALGIDLQLGASQDSWVTLKMFKFNERNKFAVPNMQTLVGATNLRYRLNGNNIMFNVVPSGGQQFRLWFIPKMELLTSDDDELEGISGWDEYVIVDAAIKAMQKEESDVQVLMVQKQALIQRINSTAENRDAGDSQCVSDTSDRGYGDAWGYGSGNNGDWFS